MFTFPMLARCAQLFLILVQSQQCLSFTEIKGNKGLATRLYGGYELYSDPDVVIDRSETHMIFGSRCEEVPTQLPNGAVLFGLRQVNGVNVRKSGSNYGQALVNCLASEPDLLTGKTVVEFGSSTFSLAAACMGSSKVIVCHPDEQSLRQVEYAHTFLNSNAITIPPVLSTFPLSEGESLPYLGGKECIVTFTDADLSRIGEVCEQSPAHILVPTEIVNRDQIDAYRQNYPEAQGIFIITP